MTIEDSIALLQDVQETLTLLKEADVFREHAYERGDDDASIVDLVNDLRRRVGELLADSTTYTEWRAIGTAHVRRHSAGWLEARATAARSVFEWRIISARVASGDYFLQGASPTLEVAKQDALDNAEKMARGL